MNFKGFLVSLPSFMVYLELDAEFVSCYARIFFAAAATTTTKIIFILFYRIYLFFIMPILIMIILNCDHYNDCMAT